MQTECLVLGDEESTIDVSVRFLHVVERKVGVKRGESLEFVDELRVGGELYLSWDEAAEREIAVGRFKLSELDRKSTRLNSSHLSLHDALPISCRPSASCWGTKSPPST